MTSGSSLEEYPPEERPDLPISCASEPELTEDDDGGNRGAEVCPRLTVNEDPTSFRTSWCDEGRGPCSDRGVDWACSSDKQDE